MTKSAEPTRWPTKPLRRLVTVRTSNVDKIMEVGEETVRLCNYVHVYYNDRITGDMEFDLGSAKASEITKFALLAGDVIITKDSETPDDIAVPALVEPSAEGIVCGYHLAILRPRPSEIFGPFLFWALLSKPTREAFGNAAQGVTRYGLKSNSLGSVSILVPDLDTQKAIATYLDRETARIDQLVAKKERLAALLDEKRFALVTAAVSGATGLGGETKSQSGVPDGADANCSREVRLRFATRLNPSKAEAGELADYGNVTFAPMDALADGLGGLDVSLERPAEELADGQYSYFAEGDLLIAKVTPCFENGKKALVAELPNRIGFATSEVHVVRADQRKIDPNYLRYLMSSEPFRAAGISSMTGAGGLRRVSDNAIKDFRLPVANLERQKAIAVFLDEETGKLERLKAKLIATVGLLREHRAALITAAVAGQLDIREKLPSVNAKPDRAKVRILVGAEIMHAHQGNPKFGRVKLQKLVYLAEVHVGIAELQGNYLREAAGPLDRALIEQIETGNDAAGFYRAGQPDGAKTAVTYAPLARAGQHKADLETLLGPKVDALRGLVAILANLDRRATEAVATLYAVWNDALLDGAEPDEAAIINGVLNDWHPEKRDKFTPDDLRTRLDWMRRHGLVPRGQGPRTAHTMTRDMFS